ncbi:oxidoreductase [Cytophagales bacterium LB-30]|uniref:Oxidoreductase n=1 Tax=Shiella aurantiaca TaxID=3058365 RepID=A0ABT8F6K6_9BACT|nr:oxidoreductase [Shiella aurantiaca]MDN4165899.1 oxidoreductase [Shiella aurantiaca]
MKKVAIITGASSGMGKSTAFELQTKGYKVYGMARRTDKMNDLKAKGMEVVSLDLTNDASIVNAVNTVLEKEGRIDVLVNNAGYGSYGSVEEVSIEEAKRQFEVNIFGLARITQLVLPTMRKQKSGRIVNISSMGGKIYTPFGAWYHATKFALEGWSDCLRIEVKPFGIDVAIVEPGGIQTEWGDIAMDNLEKVSGKGPYASMVKKVVDISGKNKNNLTPVEVLGKEIAKAATEKNPRTRYLKGYLAKPLVTLRKWLGDRTFDKMLMSQLK